MELCYEWVGREGSSGLRFVLSLCVFRIVVLSLLSATILMYSLGFEELDTGERFDSINKVEGGIVLVWVS